jgi:peptidoglycan hydrolase-like protein with peptidoglycan-binding domain
MTETLQKNKQVLIYGLVLVALVIVYFKRNTIKDFFSKSTSSPATNAANPTPSISSNTANNDSILSKGSSGEQVRRLQELLNIKHGNNKPQIIPYLVEDGKFGAATETMLKKWTGKTSITINQLIKALK